MIAHSDTDIRTQAKNGVDRAEDITVKVVLAMPDAKEKELNVEIDFEKQIQRRVADYESGLVIPISYNEIEHRVRNNFRNRIQSQV